MAVCVLTTTPANQSAAAIHTRLAFLQALTNLVKRQMNARQTLFLSHSNLSATRQASASSRIFPAKAQAPRLAQNKWKTFLTVFAKLLK